MAFQIISGVSFIKRTILTPSHIKRKPFESRRKSSLTRGGRPLCMCVLGRCVAFSLVSTQTFCRALAASVDKCAMMMMMMWGFVSSDGGLTY